MSPRGTDEWDETPHCRNQLRATQSAWSAFIHKLYYLVHKAEFPGTPYRKCWVHLLFDNVHTLNQPILNLVDMFNILIR